MELSKLSCWSVVASSLPPPPEHTEEELSTASPSASSTSLSIKSLRKNKSWASASTGMQPKPKCFFNHLRYTRIAAVLFLPKTVLLYKVVKSLRLFPHVVKRHTFCYGSCCNLEDKVSQDDRCLTWVMCLLQSHQLKTHFMFLYEVEVLVIHL